MNRPSSLALAAVLCRAALASPQDPGTGTTLADPLVVFRVDAVDQLVARWPETAVGRLCGDPELAPALTRLFAQLAARQSRRDAVLDAVAALELEVEPWVVAYQLTRPDFTRVFAHPIGELRSFEFAYAAGEDGSFGADRTLLALRCAPQFEGRWTQAFELEAARTRRHPWFDYVPDAKLDGNPAHTFRARANDTEPGMVGAGCWMLHLPGWFAYGNGLPGERPWLAPSPHPTAPGASLTVYLQRFLPMFERMGGGVPPEFKALGFDQLERLQWRQSVRGERILDELELEPHGAFAGLVAALSNGKAPLPPQPLPDGAIAQLRLSVDLPALFDVVFALGGNDLPPVPADLKQDVLAACDGGLAFAVGAPATGGVLPRMFLTLGIKDEPALARALDRLLGERSRTVKYGDDECRILEIPDAPQGLQPAFCVRGGRLHVTESGLGMRAFLKAQATDATAMDVGDAPQPDGDGDLQPGFDLRLDEVALYTAYHDTWLPLFKLFGPSGPAAQIPIDDMPSVELVAAHCGKSRGVLRRPGKRLLVQHLGPLGGPELAALAMTWGPMLSVRSQDWATDQLAQQIATRRLEAAWQAFEAFHRREQRWPKDLAELFAAEKLAKDALLLPADDQAEPLQLADGTSTRSSFRYFATPVAVRDVDDAGGVLLIEIRPHVYGRALLTATGQQPDVYSATAQQPIDTFGK